MLDVGVTKRAALAWGMEFWGVMAHCPRPQGAAQNDQGIKFRPTWRFWLKPRSTTRSNINRTSKQAEGISDQWRCWCVESFANYAGFQNPSILGFRNSGFYHPELTSGPVYARRSESANHL